MLTPHSDSNLNSFAIQLVAWQAKYGRNSLPWQNSTDAYRIWLSEIMLQQTQVKTVIPYYLRFLERFPTVETLAQASLEELMPYWAGLGYYARARNLHRCAQLIHHNYQGRFPACPQELASLPGIGRSTAAAIAAFAYGIRSPILDGNVKRVFTRYFGVFGDPKYKATENQLWDLAQGVIDKAPQSLDMSGYTQGLMDLGATVCTRTRPLCLHCPLQNTCYAFIHGAQDQLPERQKRTVTLPERHCFMLILQQNSTVLLEQQASPGIWGGLWSLPRYESKQALDAMCNHWQIARYEQQKLAPVLHTFSHFRLNIQPVRILLPENQPMPLADTNKLRWISQPAQTGIALPAPVKTLLQSLEL